MNTFSFGELGRLLVGGVLSMALVSCTSDEPYEAFDEDAAFTLLEDRIHSSRQHTGVTPNFSALNYDRSHGFSNFKHYAESLGGSTRAIASGTLDEGALDGVDVLFINLVDEDHPPFLAQEVEAVDAFVRSGGGLFVIVDHTNAYYSSERINVLLEPFGLEVGYQLACDVRERTIKEHHWLRITDPVEHPVTRGVESQVYFAAGPILGPGSLAATSEEGWRDSWNPDAPPSYWGNFRQDEDEESMSSSVMNAIEYGEGRVVVVGDQNIFGNTYWGVGDNRRLLANIWQWLAHKDDEEVAWRDRDLPKPELLVDFRVSDPSEFYASGYNPLYYNLARQPWYYVTMAADSAHATPRILLLPEPERLIEDTDPAHPQRVLEAGGQVYVFVDPSAPSSGALETLELIWPEFELPVVGTRDFVGGELGGIENRDTPVEKVFDVVSNQGDRVVWVEKAGEETDVIVKNGGVHVVLQPMVFGADQIYAVEGLLAYMHEQDQN